MYGKYLVGLIVGVIVTVAVYEEYIMPKAIDLALQEVELREMASDFDLKRKTELIKLTVETAKLSQDYEVTNVPIPCARVETEKDSNELELVNECEDNL